MAYSDNHRSFLLNICGQSLMKEIDALDMYRSIFEDENATIENMTESIGLINEKLQPLNQKINRFNSEQLESKYIVFVDADSSELMLHQGVYSEAEVQLFRSLLNEIAKEPEHYTTSIAALNLNSSMKVTKVHSQELIDNWIHEGLFAEVDDRLYLGPRGIVEFGPFLRVHHPDVVAACKLCKEPIFTGTACAKCEILAHKECLKKFLSKISKCPSCKAPWNVPL